MWVVVVDLCQIVICVIVDLYFGLKLDIDVMLFNGLFSFLFEMDMFDYVYIVFYINGFDVVLEVVGLLEINCVVQEIGLLLWDLVIFYMMVVCMEKIVIVYSQGVNQLVVGIDKVNVIINIYLVMGWIGKLGMGLFLVIGQLNVMGGCEVGGFVNMLVVYMVIENLDYWVLV